MARRVLEHRVDRLEEALIKLAEQVAETSAEVKSLSIEMKEFKDEMREFKEESEKRRRMLEKSMEEFKDEMKEFKDEMQEFKDEMRAFKSEMQEFKDKVDRILDDMNKRWGELANKMGTVVEDIIVPAMQEIAKKYFGCDEIDMMADRIVKKHYKDKSKIKEFDALVICGDKVLLNETKVTPRIPSIKKFIEFVRSGEFFEYFPEYRGKKIIPIISALNMSKDVVKYLTKEGIYAMTMNGRYMDIVNFNEIKERGEVHQESD